MSVYEGEPATFTVNAKSSKTISQVFNIAIIDRTGTIEPNVQLVTVSPYEYNATLSIAKSLPLGTYTSTLEIRLCEDEPLTCAKPIAGSPWKLPLTVTVRPQINLTPLGTIASLGAWNPSQGNARHSGYAPANFDAAKFNRRWSWTLPGAGPGAFFMEPATEGGQVFLVSQDNGRAVLWALDEATGKVNWSTSFNGTLDVRPPVVGQGLVLVSVTDSNGTSLLFFDQPTGSPVRKAAVDGLPDSWSVYSVPLTATLAGTDIYIANRRLLSLSHFDLLSGALTWDIRLGPGGYGLDMPAVDGGFVYMAREFGALEVYRASDGSLAYTIGDQRWDTDIVRPVLSGAGMAFVYNDRRPGSDLQAFDLDKRTKAWTTHGVVTVPVATPTAVYASLQEGVTAFDARTGTQLWTVPRPQGEPNLNLLATDNLVFASAGDPVYTPHTYAIDTTTRKIVWTHPQGGMLALSDRGVLYVVRRDVPGIVAINLR